MSFLPVPKAVLSKRFLLLAILFALYTWFILACDKPLQNDHYRYYQNFDAIKGWFPIPNWLSSYDIVAHSGEYCAITDSSKPYSPSLKLKFKDFDPNVPRKFKASVWIYKSSPTCDGEFCFQIKSEFNENKLWLTKSIKSSVTKDQYWTKIELESPITKEMYNSENELSLFVWNTSKGKIYVDDIYFELFRQ